MGQSTNETERREHARALLRSLMDYAAADADRRMARLLAAAELERR